MEQCATFLVILIFLMQKYVETRIYCDSSYRPLEVGTWKSSLKHLDSGVVDNKPVSMNEGQIYVYENEFPGYTIKYIHVDNLAVKTCGATAQIKSGGVGKSTVLIVLHAQTNNEIRTVVDIWGVKNFQKATMPPLSSSERQNVKSLYVLKDFRTVNRNM